MKSQKSEYKTYIANRLYKFNKEDIYSTAFVENLLRIQPNTSHIPDLIKLVDNEFSQKQENIKAKCQEIMQMKVKRTASKIRFDQIFEKNNQYYQTQQRQPQNVNTQFRIKLLPIELVEYLKSRLEINTLKTQLLQKCLVQILKIIQNYENYQKKNHYKKYENKSMVSNLNNSQLSELTNNKFQLDNQLKEQLGLVKGKISQQDIVMILNDMKKKNEQMVQQLQTKNKEEIEKNNSKNKQQIIEVLTRFDELQKLNNELMNQLTNTKNIYAETREKLERQGNLASINATKISRYQEAINYFQRQKQELKQKIMRLQNQVSNQKDAKQLALNSIKNKEQQIFQLLNNYFAKLQKQKAEISQPNYMQTREGPIQESAKIVQSKNEQISKLNAQEEVSTQHRQSMFILNINQQEEEESHADNKKELETELANAQDRIKSLQRDNQNLKQNLRNKEGEMSKMSIKYNQFIQKSIQQAKKVKQRFEKILNGYQKESKQREGIIEQLTIICQQLEGDKAKLQIKLKETKKEYNHIVGQQVKKAKQTVKTLNSKRDKFQQQNQQIQKRLIPLQKDIILLKNEKKLMEEQNTELKRKLKDQSVKLISFEQIRKQWQNSIAKYQSQLKNYQNEIVQIRKQKEKEKHQSTNEIQKLTEALRETQRNKQKKNNQLMQQITTFTVSPILEGHLQKRQLLIRQIQKLTHAKVVKSQLKYKFDQYSLNFSHYVNKQAFPILVLFKLARNKSIIGVFSTSFSNTNSKENGNAFIFSLQNGGIFHKMEGGYLQAGKYADSMLVFGNSELYIKNNSSDKVLKLNTNLIGARYFSISSDESLLGYANGGNEVKFEQMQIHRVYYA